MRFVFDNMKDRAGRSSKKLFSCPAFLFFSEKLSLQLVLMQVGDIFYRCIVIDTGNFAVVPGIGFVNDFSITYIYCHMADRAAAIFIKNQISRL